MFNLFTVLVATLFAPKWTPEVSSVDFYLEGDLVGSGSVVQIDKIPYILTASHVAWAADVACIKDACFDAAPDYFGDLGTTEGDWAIIEIDKKYLPIARRLNVNIDVGDEIIVYGNPNGLDGVQSQGIVAKIDDSTALIDCYAWFGNSGSAVYNKRGQVIGIVVALIPSNIPFNFLQLPIIVKADQIVVY